MSIEVSITDVIREVSKLDLEEFYMIKVANNISSEEMFELQMATKQFKIRGLIITQQIDFQEMTIDELIDFRNKLDEIILSQLTSSVKELDEESIIKMMNEEE